MKNLLKPEFLVVSAWRQATPLMGSAPAAKLFSASL
jgi:hypothetical protein